LDPPSLDRIFTENTFYSSAFCYRCILNIKKIYIIHMQHDAKKFVE